MLDHDKFNQLREILGDDAEGVGEIIDTFLEDTPKAIGQLKTGLADGDATTVASAAHKIKGSASTLGAMVLADLCRELEDHARGENLEAVAGRVEELEETWEATRLALEDEHPAR